jgi:hypothetical protein
LYARRTQSFILEATVSDDLKKQEIKKILLEIETSAMILINDGVEQSPAELVAELALIRYEIESVNKIQKRFSASQEKGAEVLEFKPKDTV